MSYTVNSKRGLVTDIHSKPYLDWNGQPISEGEPYNMEEMSSNKDLPQVKPPSPSHLYTLLNQLQISEKRADARSDPFLFARRRAHAELGIVGE